MAWIELHDTLPDHEKVVAVADILKMDKDLVVGKLVRLWTWALNNRESGVFKARDIATIAEVMRFRGKPQRLVDALTEARLLDKSGDAYVIHDWDERVGMLLAKRESTRAQTRARVQKHRMKTSNAAVTQSNADCNALHERCVTDDVTQSNAATVPKPYIDDDDDDNTDNRAHAREEVIHNVKIAYSLSFGRDPTNAEVDGLVRNALVYDMAELIGEAIRRAAIHGASSVVPYVGKILRAWQSEGIETFDELAELDYLQDCMSGRATGIPPDEAAKRLAERRAKE